MDIRTEAIGVWRFGLYRLDPVRRTLTRDDKPVALPPRTLDALLLLVENSDRVVSKAELIANLWPGRIVEDGSLTQLIFLLRKTLAELDPGERFVITAPGRGYRFGSPVRFEPEGATSAFPTEAPARVGETGAPAARRRWRGVAAILALIAAVGATLTVAVLWRSPTRLPPDRHGVVLADFQNETADHVFDHLLAKVLQVDLSQSRYLDVMSPAQAAETLALMTLAKNTPLTPELAAQVCARNNGGAVVAGGISAVGRRYVVTLTATDCLSGRNLAAAKSEAGSKEDTPAAVDDAARKLRRDLGESAGAIQASSVSILPKRTASFEALKAYSEATWTSGQDIAGSVALFQRAVSLDPDFAAAWDGLAVVLGNLGQRDGAAQAISRAYALRQTVSDVEKLHIEAIYQLNVTRDLDAGIRALDVSAHLYPQSVPVWVNLANQNILAGRYTEGEVAGAHAVDLTLRGPWKTGGDYAFAVRIQALTRLGRLAEAEALGRSTLARGNSGAVVHYVLAEAAYARGDRLETARQFNWAKGGPAEATLAPLAAAIAYSDGRVREGEAIMERSAELGRHKGLRDTAVATRALILHDVGFEARARADLATAPPDLNEDDYRLALARLGDPQAARRRLAADLAARPHDTLLNRLWAPLIRSALLLRSRDAAGAVAALAPARDEAGRQYDVDYALGEATLAAGDFPGAAAAFRDILSHPGRSPTTPLYPLARLGLARALRGGGDLAGARRAYAAFLDNWSSADPDVPILLAARREAAAAS